MYLFILERAAEEMTYKRSSQICFIIDSKQERIIKIVFKGCSEKHARRKRNCSLHIKEKNISS